MRTPFTALGVAGWALVLGHLTFANEPVYRVGGSVTAPRVTETVDPPYNGVQGAVVLQLEVGMEGRPDNIKVVRGLRPDLDRTAIATVQQWKFEPGKKHGKPVCVSATVEVNFLPPPSPSGDPVYKVGPDVSAPRALKMVEPDYSEDARRARVHGVVLLRASISREGRPEDILVVQSLHPDLDKNAIAALQEWEFAPGKKDGKPVRVLVIVEIDFAWSR